MLARDRNAQPVVDDIAAYVSDPKAALPSGAEAGAVDRLAALVDGKGR